MPVLLDVCSGSRSWSRSFAELDDWECLSVDNDPKHSDTTWIADIMQWAPPEGLIVDVVCIGVPCTAYSTANKRKTAERFQQTRALWLRAFALADQVLRPGGIIVCENPARTELTGCKSQPTGDMQLMRPELFRSTVCYCMYSEPEHVYSWKATVLWSNVDLAQHGFTPKFCCKATRCSVGAVDPRTGAFKHQKRMSFAPERRNQEQQCSQTGDWSTMPRLLCNDVRDACLRALSDAPSPEHAA